VVASRWRQQLHRKGKAPAAAAGEGSSGGGYCRGRGNPVAAVEGAAAVAEKGGGGA
jgi:hypothetical protein